MTAEPLEALHDVDLRALDTDEARDVLARRGRAAREIRLMLARVHGCADMATARYWHVVPCLTADDTLGVLDIARGTAWDSGVPAVVDDVAALGLIGGSVVADANMAYSGTVAIDGVPVQRDGAAVVDGRVVPPRMPDGWRQIALPTWRGYDPNAGRYVPVPAEEFVPSKWIRPRLVAAGLMTCYGHPGDPADGRYLTRASGPADRVRERWPHGIPEWIDTSPVRAGL